MSTKWIYSPLWYYAGLVLNITSALANTVAFWVRNDITHMWMALVSVIFIGLSVWLLDMEAKNGHSNSDN